MSLGHDNFFSASEKGDFSIVMSLFKIFNLFHFNRHEAETTAFQVISCMQETT
jgi:hypothetical protein